MNNNDVLNKFEELIFNTKSFKVGNKIGRNVLVNCDHGTMIINRFDYDNEKTGHGQWLMDHGNASTIEVLHCWNKIKTQQNPIIFDVGANIGTYTTWMSRIFPEGKIYSFEPQRSVFQILCGNLAINNLYNVYAYNIAIGSENKRIVITEPNYFSNNDFGTFSLIEDVIKEKSENKMIVQVNTIDWFIKYYNVEKIDLLKIDAEGMDLDVLIGGLETIKKFFPVIFIEHNNFRKSIIEEIQEILNEFGYKYELYQNNMLCVR